MESRIMQVFYGNDCLPYKDKERQVHYPVVGNSFTGASETTKIRFYVKDIGGVENVTWVAVVKLPNGKIGFKVLSTIGNDLEVGERYIEFSLNSFYTQYNGDLAIALKGYQGNIQVEEDEETGIYEIFGTPTIQATGVIKLSVNYSTQLPVTQGFSPDELVQLMALIAEKLNIASGIVVLLNDEEDISGYTNGQLFYVVSRNQFMQLVENELEEKELKVYDLVPGQQATTSIIANTLTNVNGRVLSAYESQIVIVNDFQCYKITRGGENLTEEYASRYMEFMTGSKYLPKYDYDYPKNTYLITPSGLILKPQYDSTNGLLLYPMTNLATRDYVDNDILEITDTATPLTYEQRQKILTHNVRIKYNNFYYEKVNHLGHNVRFECADLIFATNQDGSTTISKRFIVIRDDTGSITASARQLVTYSKAQADQYFANNVEMSIDSNYVLKVKLIDKNGNQLAEDSVDLPLESIVQSAQYYETYTYQGTTYENVIVITLATTDVPTIIPVGDLVSGLVSESTFNNAVEQLQTDINACVQQTDLNVKSYRGAYIGSNSNILYEQSGQDIKLFIYGTIAVVINNNMYAVTLAQVNADNPNSTILNNNILEVTLNAGNSLVYDTTDGKIKIVSQFGITNTQIILIKTSANQINGGVLYTKLLEKCLETELTKYRCQFYDISNFFKIEETLSSYVYFYASQIIGRVGPTGEYTMSQLATQLGVSLFTSPSGIENCLRIDNTYSLVYNVVSNQYQIVERTNISKYHIILLSNVGGKVVGGELISQSTKYRDWYEKVMQIYNAGGNFYPYIECDRKNAKIYFSYENIFVSRVLPSAAQIGRTCVELATQLGVSLVTSPNGHTNCIEINETIALTFNIINGKQRLVNRDNVTVNEIILISNIGGKIVTGIFKDYTVEYSNNSDIHNYIQEYNKGSAFVNLFNDSEENDSYLFFTDPHTTTTEQAFTKLLGYISKYNACIPFDFVLCGGDWLRNSDSLLNAKYKLGYVTSEFNKNIKNYHQILGNHDNNYQGEDELSKQELVNIYNRENGSNYYSFATKNTTYYCLDTGSDWEPNMNTYRWEQINWLANKLLSDNAKHSVIAMHIYWNDITNYNLSQMATNLNSLIIAYNTRTSITLNGISYDFSSKNGHIEYVICGHIHGDKNAKIGTIPVFSTYNAWDSSDMTITFDMLFADYDNRKLYLVREGKGSNRTFDLDTGDLL